MRTFYDFRGRDYQNPHKYPLQGRVILKSKYKWLLWVYADNHVLAQNQFIKSFVVAPRSIYLSNVYIAKSFWDALKYFIRIKRKI